VNDRVAATLVSDGSIGAASGALTRALRILMFVAFTGVGAQLAVRLPGTPVPVTMQTLFVVLAGVVLGARDGFFAMLAYLAVGVAGAPVFAEFGFGPQALVGLTGGYLIAFPAAALLAGAVRGRIGGGRLGVFSGTLAGLAFVLLMGTLHLSLVSGMGIARAASLGALPFIGGELFKTAAAVAIAGRR
jgi:biotin transport system substrate-specific component